MYLHGLVVNLVALTTAPCYMRSPSLLQTNVSQSEFRITFLGAPREAKCVNKNSETDRPLFVTNKLCVPVKNKFSCVLCV